ncbi:MAG: hypothetical protein ABIS06_12065, partial [Vicinamibacterales bacterium]
VFELVQQRMPSRPIEAPGAIAWLRQQLSAYRRHLSPSDGLMFGWREFSAAPDRPRLVASWRMPLARCDQQGKPD